MSIIYNPTISKFLTVAQARTNDGQKDIRLIIDLDTNIFYTLDDNGNLQTSDMKITGGTFSAGTITFTDNAGNTFDVTGIDVQTLSGVLAEGNETDGNNIIVTDGDSIVGDNLNLEGTTTLYAIGGDSEFYLENSLGYIKSFNGDVTCQISVEAAGTNFYKYDDSDAEIGGEVTISDSSLNIQFGNFDYDADQYSKIYFQNNNGVVEILLENLPIYVDNADAISSKATVDSIYKTSTGELRIVV